MSGVTAKPLPYVALARAGLAGIAAVLLPIMDDGCWHSRQRAPSGVILAMREEMSGSTLKR